MGEKEMELKQAWEIAVQFHGCECPALAIGTRATAYVMECFGMEEGRAANIVCTAESFSCAVDAIQAIMGCTMGNGKLRVQSRRRMAFRFCNVDTEQSIYLSLRPWLQDRPGLTEKLLRMPIKRLFLITETEEVPEKAPNCILSSGCSLRNPKPSTETAELEPLDESDFQELDLDW